MTRSGIECVLRYGRFTQIVVHRGLLPIGNRLQLFCSQFPDISAAQPVRLKDCKDYKTVRLALNKHEISVKANLLKVSNHLKKTKECVNVISQT